MTEITIQDLGSIGELIAAIATIATLAYLAIQIRQNTHTECIFSIAWTEPGIDRPLFCWLVW